VADSMRDCSAVGWVNIDSENGGDVTWADMGMLRNFMYKHAIKTNRGRRYYLFTKSAQYEKL
jgi:hypothetical protein